MLMQHSYLSPLLAYVPKYSLAVLKHLVRYSLLLHKVAATENSEAQELVSSVTVHFFPLVRQIMIDSSTMRHSRPTASLLQLQ